MASSASFYLWNGWLSKGIACKCVCCFCLYLLHFWLDIVFLCIMEGEHLLRLERAVYRDLHDLSATVPRVNRPNLTSIAVCHTHQHFWWAMHLQYVTNSVNMLHATCQNVVYLLNERSLSVATLALPKVGEMFLTYHNTMYFIFMYICKSNRSCTETTLLKGFCTYSTALQLWKLLQIQTFILPDFSHHLSKIVIIRFLCFSLLRNKLDYEQITT